MGAVAPISPCLSGRDSPVMVFGACAAAEDGPSSLVRWAGRPLAGQASGSLSVVAGGGRVVACSVGD